MFAECGSMKELHLGHICLSLARFRKREAIRCEELSGRREVKFASNVCWWRAVVVWESWIDDWGWLEGESYTCLSCYPSFWRCWCLPLLAGPRLCWKREKWQLLHYNPVRFDPMANYTVCCGVSQLLLSCFEIEIKYKLSVFFLKHAWAVNLEVTSLCKHGFYILEWCAMSSRHFS